MRPTLKSGPNPLAGRMCTGPLFGYDARVVTGCMRSRQTAWRSAIGAFVQMKQTTGCDEIAKSMHPSLRRRIIIVLLPIGQRTSARQLSTGASRMAAHNRNPRVHSLETVFVSGEAPPTFRVTNDAGAVGTVDSRFPSNQIDTVEKLFGFIKDAIAHHPDMMTGYDDAGLPDIGCIDYRKTCSTTKSACRTGAKTQGLVQAGAGWARRSSAGLLISERPQLRRTRCRPGFENRYG